MTEQEKQLLLKDLCARLPYGVMCKIQTRFVFEDGTLRRCSYDKILDLDTVTEINEWKETGELEKFKPYLRPMSSMTEEEKREYFDVTQVSNHCAAIDWLNSHHFDFRNLVGKGLAIDCTDLNIY